VYFDVAAAADGARAAAQTATVAPTSAAVIARVTGPDILALSAN
jgi:hypothetical protein